MDAIECVAGRGMLDNRFFGYRDNCKGHITFFAMEVWEEALQRELQLPGALPQATRRNAFVRNWIVRQ